MLRSISSIRVDQDRLPVDMVLQRDALDAPGQKKKDRKEKSNVESGSTKQYGAVRKGENIKRHVVQLEVWRVWAIVVVAVVVVLVEIRDTSDHHTDQGQVPPSCPLWRAAK